MPDDDLSVLPETETDRSERPSEADLAAAERVERDRERIFRGVLRGEDDTIEKRVALLLNHYPDTRDSDLRLQLTYWRVFDGWDGAPISEEQMFAYARLPSLTRVRARIQNQLRLFRASPSVQQRRGTLEEEERERAREAPDRSASLTVFADESGKNETFLIVGGVWFGDSADVFALQRAILKWRQARAFDAELHFVRVNDQTEALFREAIDLTLATAASISFKALRLPRHGLSNVPDALDRMLYHMLIDGVSHEHETGRSPLPRELVLWKDQETPGTDALRLADLRDRIAQAGSTVFSGRLQTGEFKAVPSDEFDVMQIADLFVGAIGRRINTPNANPRAKDRFAEYLLGAVGLPAGPEIIDLGGDAVLTTGL